EGVRRRRCRHPARAPDTTRHGQAGAPAGGNPGAVPDDGATDAPAVRGAQQAVRRRDRAARRAQRGRDRDDHRQDPPPLHGGEPMTTRPATGGERILVVDDEPDIVALVAYHLVKAGYRVSTASTGPDAVAQARQERPAVVILDLMLPGMSGFEVLEQLRGEESTKDVAVLMLTARKDEP